MMNKMNAYSTLSKQFNQLLHDRSYELTSITGVRGGTYDEGYPKTNKALRYAIDNIDAIMNIVGCKEKASIYIKGIGAVLNLKKMDEDKAMAWKLEQELNIGEERVNYKPSRRFTVGRLNAKCKLAKILSYDEDKEVYFICMEAIEQPTDKYLLHINDTGCFIRHGKFNKEKKAYDWDKWERCGEVYDMNFKAYRQMKDAGERKVNDRISSKLKKYVKMIA